MTIRFSAHKHSSSTPARGALYRSALLLGLLSSVIAGGACGVVVPDLQQCLAAYAECGIIEYVPMGPGVGHCACVDDVPLEPTCRDDFDCSPGTYCSVSDDLYYNDQPPVDAYTNAMTMSPPREPELVGTCQPLDVEPNLDECAADEVLVCDQWEDHGVGDDTGDFPMTSCWCELAYYGDDFGPLQE
ncbi:MAG: hypothetical protein ACO3JL_06400 [Myxococcota bacterium]